MPDVVYLSDAFIPSRGADSIQIVHTCEALGNQGVDVRLVCPAVNPNTQSLKEYYNIEQKFSIGRIPFRPFERYQLSILSALKTRSLDPVTVYGRFIPSCFFAALWSGKVIIESHSPARDSGKIIGLMFEMLVRTNRLQALIVISEALKEYYIEQYTIDPEKIYVVPDAAKDPGNVDPIINCSNFSVGYVGHLYKGKGMEMIAELARRHPNVEFHIVGGEEEDINYWVRSLSDHQNVVFHGFVEPANVPAYQMSFDILLAPYGNTVYGSAAVTDLSQWMSPLKLFEYMAVGKPIITSNLPVINEVMEDERTCLLCKPEDVDAWSAALARLQKDSDFRRSLGTAARRKFEDCYTYDARARKIRRVIRQTS